MIILSNRKETPTIISDLHIAAWRYGTSIYERLHRYLYSSYSIATHISLYVASMLSDTLNIINVDNFSILYCDILQLLLQILILFLNINFDACDIFYVFIIGDTHTQRAYSKNIQKIFRKRPLDNRTSSRYYLNVFWIYVLFLDITWHIDVFC